MIIIIVGYPSIVLLYVFSNSFNSQYPTSEDKLEAIQNHLASLGSKSEQKYFALSFPRGVANVGNEDLKDYLLRITR